MSVIALRPIEDSDLDALYEQQSDPIAVHMAAFTPEHPDDRAAFDAHMARIRSAADVTNRAVTRDGTLVGSVAAFVMDGETEVTYWIDRSAWGSGIASQALMLLLELVTVRPIYARAASDNLASLRVLSKAGFAVIGTERSYANARGTEIEEPFCVRTPESRGFRDQSSAGGEADHARPSSWPAPTGRCCGTAATVTPTDSRSSGTTVRRAAGGSGRR